MKLLIAIVSNRDWKPGFCTSLISLALHLSKKGVDFVIFSFDKHSLLPFGRQQAVDKAIADGFSHILFLDDDMKYTTTAFDSIADREVDFIGANCTTKTEVRDPLARGVDGQRISSIGKHGIEKITRIGLGFTLIKCDVFKKIEYPYFSIKWATNTETGEKKIVGEDHLLCRFLLEAGVNLYVDHDAARHVWHIGDFDYQENFQ